MTVSERDIETAWGASPEMTPLETIMWRTDRLNPAPVLALEELAGVVAQAAAVTSVQHDLVHAATASGNSPVAYTSRRRYSGNGNAST